MRRFCFALYLLAVALSLPAQTIDGDADSRPLTVVLIGYLSYDSLLHAMPQYAAVQQQMDTLRLAYEREMKRVENEFNQKYETFLEERSQYPRTILLKRQNELQDLMQSNIAFRNQGLHDLQEARQMALAPLRRLLSQTIAAVAADLHLAVVVNTDSEACPYVDPDVSIDISQQVAGRLEQTDSPISTEP